MDLTQILDVILLPIGLAVVAYFYQTANALRNDLANTLDDLNKWKLSVVQTYATKGEVEKMEARIIGALERLDVKIERVLGHVKTHGND
jgi:hypothetical protein